MDIQDETFERYFPFNLSSSCTNHLSQGYSFTVSRIPLPRNSSKPISNEHSRSLNLNPSPPHNRYLKQQWVIPLLTRTASYPNVPNSKESAWPARSVFEQVPMIATHLEGRLHPHPPLTPRITNLMIMTSENLRPRGNIWPHHGRAGPSSGPNPSSQLTLSMDPPSLVLARALTQINHGCFGGAR